MQTLDAYAYGAFLEREVCIATKYPGDIFTQGPRGKTITTQ